MYDDEDDFCDVSTPSGDTYAVDFAVIGLGFVGDLLDAGSNLVENLRFQFILAANRKRDRKMFAEEAALEIERIISGDA